MDRRKFIAATCSTVGMSAIGMPALAQAKTKIRVGYLHTLAVDGQIWLAEHLGHGRRTVSIRNSRSSRPASSCLRPCQVAASIC